MPCPFLLLQACKCVCQSSTLFRYTLFRCSCFQDACPCAEFVRFLLLLHSIKDRHLQIGCYFMPTDDVVLSAGTVEIYLDNNGTGVMPDSSARLAGGTPAVDREGSCSPGFVREACPLDSIAAGTESAREWVIEQQQVQRVCSSGGLPDRLLQEREHSDLRSEEEELQEDRSGGSFEDAMARKHDG